MILNDSVRSRLISMLLRLAIELEAGCAECVKAGGDVFDAPFNWLDDHGFKYLLADFEHRTPRSIAALGDDESELLLAAGKTINRALFVADEVEQLDGEAALDYVAGWIGGASDRAHDVDHYLSSFVEFVPLYRDEFKAGYTRGNAEAINIRRQANKKSEAHHV